jgi:site-specific DNA-methyltransferase (adenine-specific)
VNVLYDVDGLTLIHGDAMEWMASEWCHCDAVVTDPAYGETSLKWDRWPVGWLALARNQIKVNGSLWCFGSMRMFLAEAAEFSNGWRFVQDLIWEKQNGSSSAADRFRRVHEVVCQFVRDDAKWADIFKSPVTTPDAVARAVRRKKRPTHWGGSEGTGHEYESHDGGPRLMRSVLQIRNMHGRAIHPTQKPEGIVEPLLRYSVPPRGLVLDPFAGSGTTLAVARQLGMRAIGIEANREYAERAADRLRLSLPLGGAA